MGQPVLPYALDGKRVFVAGHRGLVGSAVVRRLEREKCEIVTASHERLDLCLPDDTRHFLAETKPHVVVLAAARVGGISANSRFPVDFLFDNLAIEMNVIRGAFETGVERLLFLGSSCIYPRLAEQPIREESLLTGPLEPTNEPYAIAKIAGIEMCQAYRRQHGASFISLMPTNILGPGDNYHPENSHVVAALIRRMHEAKTAAAESVIVWGSGTPKREFLYSDDLADACVFALRHYDGDMALNVGTGTDISIADLAREIAEVVGFEGRIEFDPSRPDGTPRKVLDVSRLAALGWRARTPLREALRLSYENYLELLAPERARVAAPADH